MFSTSSMASTDFVTQAELGESGQAELGQEGASSSGGKEEKGTKTKKKKGIASLTTDVD